MKRIIAVALSAVFLLSITVLSVDAQNAGVYNWYCMRKTNHSRPTCEPNMEFIKEYNGYYIGDDAQEKVVYLTFDAGYENGNVETILNTLNKEGVKGAFFVLSHIIEANPGLIKKMSEGGHLVCNHTASHKDMTKIHKKEEFAKELEKLEELYAETTGKEMPKYYRPPEGKFSRENLAFANELGYKTVFWSLAYSDWDNAHQMSCEKAKKKILDNVHNGAVILLHPTSATNAKILSDVIRSLRAEGYSFGTLDELTGKVGG